MINGHGYTHSYFVFLCNLQKILHKKKRRKKKENETSTYITMYSVDVIYVNCNGKGFH